MQYYIVLYSMVPYSAVWYSSGTSLCRVVQCELELVREEKKTAEAQLRTLQREQQLQEENLRQEAEKLARVSGDYSVD